MGKIILLADLHLGVTGRHEDILWAMEVVSEYAIRNEIEYIVVLGDLNHDRKELPVEVACATYEFFLKQQMRGLTWIVFPGNHDMYLKHSWSINSLIPFQDVLTIVNDVKLLLFDNRRFWVLPFIYSESAYMTVLKLIEKQYQHQDVLLTHIGVKSATLNRCFMIQNWSTVDFTESVFDQVFTGHFHVRQQVGDNVWYPGSLIPFKFDEGDISHGFMVYDLETRTHDFVDIWETGKELVPAEHYPQQYCTFIDTKLDEKTQEDTYGNIVRIALTSPATQSAREAMKIRLQDFGAKSVTFWDIGEEEKIAAAISVGEIIPLDEAFLNWIDVEDKDNVAKKYDRKLLLRINAAVCATADEIYSSTISD